MEFSDALAGDAGEIASVVNAAYTAEGRDRGMDQ